MRCEMVSKTDVGRQRLRNEDNYLLMEEYGLSVIADGMGGHVDGNIASQIAVDTLRDRYGTHYQQIQAKEYREVQELLKSQEEFVVEAVQEANRNIFARNKNSYKMEGMGTTLVALQVGDGYALTACVGDSRIYLLRRGKLLQITQDHSLVSELMRYNIIDKADLLFAHNKNIITRALGMSENVLVDTTSQETQGGDIFLLCSDGLTDLVPDEQIEGILSEGNQDIFESAETLVSTANEQGGQDNITVSLVKIID